MLARVLTARGYLACYFDAEAAPAYLTEAMGLARALGDRWRLSQILVAQVVAALAARDPIAARAAAEGIAALQRGELNIRALQQLHAERMAGKI